MNEQLNRPKGFGEILDTTFRLCKSRFTDFFTIALVLIGPVYLLQVLILMLSGTSFFREAGPGNGFMDQIMAEMEQEPTTADLFADLANGLVGMLTMVAIPFAAAATLFAVNHLRKNETFTPGAVIKQALSKFGQILASSIVYGLIVSGIVFVPVFVITILTVIAAVIHPIAGIAVGVILFAGVGIGALLLLPRWSFFLGATIFENNIPGLSRSWRMTDKHTWKLAGLYIVLSVITFGIGFAIEAAIIFVLGLSVLYTIIVNLVGLFTTMIFVVGYAVVYFDLKAKHDADDLKGMIADYDDAGR